MADKKYVDESRADQAVVDRAKDFWEKYSKMITIIAGAVIVLGGGWLAYKYFVKEPKEEKAREAIYKAEEYYRMDSLQKALQGDGSNPGLLNVISNYGGTKAGNLARFYAGDAYLRLGEYKRAEDFLSDFSTESGPVQARAYKLLADAYAGQGKNDQAMKNYERAADEFEDDQFNSSEYLFLAAYFAQTVMNNRDKAIELYKELKEEYPQTEKGYTADKYLAQLGVITKNE